MSSHPEERPVICTGCGIANRADAHFCGQCRAPLTSHAVTDPFASIFARGYMVGKASSKPRSPIVVLGIWLMFGPVLASTLWGFRVFCEMLAQDGVHTIGGAFATATGMLLFLGAGWLSGTILYKTTTNYMAQSSSRDSTDGTATSNDSRHDADNVSNSVEENCCLQCGQPIPPEETTCSKCGWSFNDAE